MSGSVIVADDRTGALETAGALAQRDGSIVPVRFRTLPAPVDGQVVVDLGSRHLPPTSAAEAVAGLGLGRHAGWVGHKVDSLLRGNVAAEISGLRASTGRRLLLVPASPGLGRTCVGGVVRADGIPVADLVDARSPATTSRPSELLGAAEVDAPRLIRWLGGSDPVAVCDAETEDDLIGIAAVMAGHPHVIIAGPAAVIAATCPPWSPNISPTERFGDHVMGGRVVVVVGSVHPSALAQADALERATTARVFRTDLRAGSTPDEVLADLAARAATALAEARTIVIVGGDTAAAVLGDATVEVCGLVATGMPWFRASRFPGATVITKPGSFGGPNLLVDVLSGRIGR